MASTRCQRRSDTVPPPGMNTKEPFMTICGPLNNPGFYTFCSGPKPVEKPKYRNNVPRPRGVHDFYNMMWDPHVYRGSSFVTFDKAEEDRCRQRKAAGTGNQARRRVKKNSRLMGGIEIPTTPPQDGKASQNIQTERFLEELSSTLNEMDACTQTDAMHDAPIPEAFIPAKFGLDMYTQIEPGELFDFAKEVCPIVENMVNKILEQSLLEVMEEEELEALRDQQRAYEELRRQELLRLQRLVEREQKIQEEQKKLMEKLRDERVSEFATEDRIGSYLFSCNYLRELVPKSMESLRRDGYLQNRAEMYASLVPWLNKAVTIEVQSTDISRMLLDDILRVVSLRREEEMGNTIFAEDVPPRMSDMDLRAEDE